MGAGGKRTGVGGDYGRGSCLGAWAGTQGESVACQEETQSPLEGLCFPVSGSACCLFLFFLSLSLFFFAVNDSQGALPASRLALLSM